jgi:hypothetical protein
MANLVVVAYDSRLGRAFVFSNRQKFSLWLRKVAKLEGTSISEIKDSLVISEVSVDDLEGVL